MYKQEKGMSMTSILLFILFGIVFVRALFILADNFSSGLFNG